MSGCWAGCWGASILNFDSQVMHKFTMDCEYFIQIIMLLIFNTFIDFFGVLRVLLFL
ncbi:hypothetical protein BvCms2BK_03797 [Escherichia coli]|nr:hypothetical protein A317_04046 [Escherichia coli KTE154]SLP37856.1 Uncharacterised protein [Klebsiella pneumoniae]SQO32398.1 Uncharacterised protein [Escherichia coli]SQO46008.1 Uncharacterised protein [Escherichia coli]GCG55199.1 hypothetical protein BvCms19BK_00147 [Escherichia coli]